MNHSLSLNFFESYEEQLRFFAETTQIHLLPMTRGKAAFCRDLGNWFNEYNEEEGTLQFSYILPNPELGMSFPTALDVLSTILSIHDQSKNTEHEAKSLLNEFGIDPEKANQPLISFSGGELLLLSYAKAIAMMPLVNSLVACSPVYWLNRRNYRYWNLLIEQYKKNNKSVKVALLAGEPIPQQEPKECINTEQREKISQLKWKLIVDRPKVIFKEIKFPISYPEVSLLFTSDSNEIDLISPTLITGDNGVGKSILAKLLSGIVKPVDGGISSFSENGKSNARLLFQDSIDQIFGMSIDNHLDWVFRFDSDKADIAKSVYEEIETSLRSFLTDNHFESLIALGEANKRATLLQVKIGLIAERIASLPSLLVLDEPSWGLSKTISHYFVKIICQQAHKYGIAVALISHQLTWWKSVINSHIDLTKAGKEITKITRLEI
ncbi:ATP-binding cassette domain-containing protein [Gimesia maris]|uniref:ATP-binding cassette domain-containing protein n=1 Tax=Gimesia maris TaxID=122 RepID=UPI0032EC88D0